MDAYFRSDKRAKRDLSLDLRDEAEWKIGTLSTLQYLSYLSAIAVEPVGGLLAVGELVHAGYFAHRSALLPA